MNDKVHPVKSNTDTNPTHGGKRHPATVPAQ